PPSSRQELPRWNIARPSRGKGRSRSPSRAAMTRSWVEKPAVTTISPLSRTVSPMRSLRASAWVSGRLSRGRPSTGVLLKAGHRAVFENAQRGAPVDPAVEADRDGHETVAVGIVDVDGKRGGVAAGAHRAEAGRVDGFE